METAGGRRVGYLKLASFTARTQPDVAAAMERLQVRMVWLSALQSLCLSMTWALGRPARKCKLSAPVIVLRSGAWQFSSTQPA